MSETIAIGAYVTHHPPAPTRPRRRSARYVAPAPHYPSVFTVRAVDGARALCQRVGDLASGRIINFQSQRDERYLPLTELRPYRGA